MKRCVIIGGAEIREYGRVKKYLDENDYYVFCDSGLKHSEALKVEPDLIIGDFDSHENPGLNVETITLPCEKDDTDTVYAVKEALSRGFEKFLLIGVFGNRLDHTLCNLSALLYLDSLKKTALAVDDYSEFEIVSSSVKTIDDSFAFFSLLNISGTAKAVTVTGAKYPLKDAEISCEYQYAVSNEVIKGKRACVSVGEGRLLLVRDFA